MFASIWLAWPMGAMAHPGHSLDMAVASLDEMLHLAGHILGNPAVFLSVVAFVVLARLVRRGMSRARAGGEGRS
ncbi:hypothetical protein ACFQHZ_04180 [Marivibrio halodurans]|nr:hypothetical protein [Marivibrio halodurans]